MYVKPGMGGSRCGRGRREGTEVLKENSRSARRQQDQSAIEEQLTPGYLAPSLYAPDPECRSDDEMEYQSEMDYDPYEYMDWDVDVDVDFVDNYDLENDPFNCE